MVGFNTAEKFLIKIDPIIGQQIKQNGHIDAALREDYFTSLVRSVVSQQISVKAAAKIFGRLQDTTNLTPESVAALDDQAMQTIGLSSQKRRYIRDIADHFINQPETFTNLDKLNDDVVIEALTHIVGIGKWTAQMFLLFTLARPDIFAPDDRGLQMAIEKLYDFKSIPTKTQLIKISKNWAPYRSTASLHLWRSLANTPN